MQRTCELSHGGGISFVLDGLGGASDLCGNAPVKELSAQNRWNILCISAEAMDCTDVMSSWSMKVCRDGLIYPLGSGLFFFLFFFSFQFFEI